MKYELVGIRLLTAMVLFVFLSQVNVWADTQTHLVLAVGYRAFLLAAPLFLILGMKRGMRLALGLGVVAVIFSFVSFNSFALGLFALSMAVSGYLCKYLNSHTAKGAADNKVSLNIGAIGSGVLLMSLANQNGLLGICLAALFVSFALSFGRQWYEMEDPAPKPSFMRKMNVLPSLGWGLVGIATGIKLTGVFAVLPQYLILEEGGLPRWFGAMIFLNSLAVIFFQHRIMSVLDRSAEKWTTILSASAMLLLMLPAVFKTEILYFAVAWIIFLSFGECALSRYDRLAVKAGYLFPKEVMVGVGSLITVALSRSLPGEIYWSGLVGFVCLLVGLGTLQIVSKNSEIADLPSVDMAEQSCQPR